MSYTVLGLIALGVILAVILLYNIDDASEDRRRAYQQVSRILHDQFGLVWLPELLDDVVIGDLDGAAIKMIHLAKLFQHPDQVTLEVDKAFWRIFNARIKDPVFLAKVKDTLTPPVAAKV